MTKIVKLKTKAEREADVFASIEASSPYLNQKPRTYAEYLADQKKKLTKTNKT